MTLKIIQETDGHKSMMYYREQEYASCVCLQLIYNVDNKNLLYIDSKFD